MPTNDIMATSIGSFVFSTMKPEPQGPGQRIVVESRAGVPGVGLWQVGVAGREFQVETIVDMSSWATAVALAASYKSLQASNPQTIVFGGVTMPYLVQVLDVHATAESCIGIGGLSVHAVAIVRAQWKLIAV